MPTSLRPSPALALEVTPHADPLGALGDLPGAFALRSSLPDPDSPVRRARWSFFGADPFASWVTGAEAGPSDPAAAMAAWRACGAGDHDTDLARSLGVPFTGGAVGYWAYDYGRRLERLPERARDDLSLPDLVLALYDVVVARDEDSGRTWMFSSGLPAPPEARARRARERLDAFRARLESPAPPRAAPPAARATQPATSTFGRERYLRAVESVRDAIARGDIFQANLSQRWSLPMPGAHAHALVLDEALRRHTPSPFAATLCLGDHAILSASPELFLRRRGPQVETRPIKGTRPRGADAAEDERLAAELQASVKDRAENVMIVDVLRNDLGRVCATGSVAVPQLCALERFPQVWHLTSTVTGRLRETAGPFDLLHACFPGGSITGAPKIRAMELLEGLEPVRRHIYTGAIGWVGWNGDADWNIAIRTATATGRGIHWSAGGGITGDSDPEAEYLESVAKAEGLRLAFSSVYGMFDIA
jgi:para-aminobenzoate synthetase component 1